VQTTTRSTTAPVGRSSMPGTVSMPRIVPPSRFVAYTSPR